MRFEYEFNEKESFCSDDLDVIMAFELEVDSDWLIGKIILDLGMSLGGQ